MVKSRRRPGTAVGTVPLELKRLREELGLTQEQLCTKAGVSLDAVSRIESGRRIPRLDTLARLADALEIGLADLLRGSVRQPPSLTPSVRRLLALVADETEENRELIEAVAKTLLRQLKKKQSVT